MLVRILLDTCTIRNHLHATGSRLDLGAIQASTEQLRFSLPGGVGVELLEQLTEGRLSWTEWSKNIPIFDSILDQRWPLLPTGRQLSALTGTQSNIHIDIENERRHLRAAWQYQRLATSTTDLQRVGSYEGADGNRYGIKLDLAKLKSVATAERDYWKDYILRMQAILNSSEPNGMSEAEILSLMKGNQGTYPGDPPNLGDMLDATARVITRFVHQSLKKRDPYNPFADKRRGDVFDISLLFYIPLPAVICTADEKFVNRLRGTGALHAHQVVSVDEFNDLVAHNSVGDLVNAFRTPTEQHQRWSDAAYFNWIRRGRPLEDGQVDWFEVEPIA